MDKGLRKSREGNYGEWNDIMNGINADLIIARSSRAFAQVSPLILDTTLNLYTYNLGLDGHQFSAQYTRHQFYQQYILHVMDLFTLKKEMTYT